MLIGITVQMKPIVRISFIFVVYRRTAPYVGEFTRTQKESASSNERRLSHTNTIIIAHYNLGYIVFNSLDHINHGVTFCY